MSRVDDLAGDVTVLILGGGRGTRLHPLTMRRSKPAVPIAAKYRLIDIPISNAINSRMQRMYVLTQFNSVSLHRHIGRTYRFDAFSSGYVQILGTDGEGLRLRSDPGLSGTPVFLGFDEEVFEVRDGPQESDGYVWWYLVAPYDESRNGWAAADFLGAIPSP